MYISSPCPNYCLLQDNNHTSDVEKVMGKYNAANVAILNTPSYLGVDYAPPTPAPAREHIIGEEDEVDTAEPVIRSAREHIRKPSQPPAPRQPSGSSLRPPANPPPLPKPSSSSLKPPSGSWDAPMAPPQLPTKPSHKPHQSSSGGAKSDTQHSKKRPLPSQKLSPLTMPSNNKKSGLSSQQSIEDDKKLEDIFKEMKHPHAIPEPLSGIETPRVDVDYTTQKQKKNVYMGMGFNPFRVDDSNNGRSSSPQKKLSENIKTSSESANASPNPSVNKDSSSSEQDSSSESESEVESDKEKEDAFSGFDLGSLKPIKSPQVTPSPRHPIPSPYSAQPSLSPAASQPPGPGGKAGAASPLPTFPGLPELLAPLSPLEPMLSADSDQESRVKVKQRSDPSRTDVTSEEETRRSFKENKKLKSSNKRSRKASVKSGSGSEQRHKSRAQINDDSDSEPEPPVTGKMKNHGRSLSSTPTKKPSSKKQPGSAQSTPRQRPTSTHSTPSRDRKRDPSASPSSKYRKPSSVSKSGKTVPSRSSSVSLSEDDDFPMKSPEPVKKTKSAVLSSVFGGFKGGGGGKGGKGKDKNRGKGGITVVEKEESTQIQNDKVPSVSESSPSVNNHQSSPKVSRDKGKKNSWTNCIPQEDHKSLPNISKKDAPGLSDDLRISASDDDSIASPALSRHQPFTPSSSLNNGSGQRPSLLISIPLSKLGKSLDSLQNKFRSKNKKQIVKQECWITSEDERGGSGRKRKPSESPVKSESDHRLGPTRPSDKTAQHRKSKERTHLGDKASEIVSESRKRRDRDLSPDNANDSESDQFSKRLRTSPSPPNSIRSLEANQGSYFGPGQSQIVSTEGCQGKLSLCTFCARSL